jgi:hypothetical protein
MVAPSGRGSITARQNPGVIGLSRRPLIKLQTVIKARRSVASVVVNAAYNLMSSAVDEASTEKSHRIGQALLACEVLGMEKVDEERRKRSTQGIEITLGFYEKETLDFFKNDENQECAEGAISRALGGFTGAVQLAFIKVAEPWHPNQFQIPQTPDVRLDRIWRGEIKPDSGTPPGIGHPWAAIVLRRVRYRGSVDHANKSGAAGNLLCWTTPTTLDWFKRARFDESKFKKLNWLVAKLGSESLGTNNTDMASGDRDDWGAVDLARDKLRVLEVTTPFGVTHADTSHILSGRAGNFIETEGMKTRAETDRPLRPFIEKANYIAGLGYADRYDVVILHRGGNVNPKNARNPNVSAEDRRDFAAACRRITMRGIEVVVGIGHGNISVLRDDGDTSPLPVGIFEATTPTAAAQWIVREHINTRLVDAVLDPGQPPR